MTGWNPRGAELELEQVESLGEPRLSTKLAEGRPPALGRCPWITCPSNDKSGDKTVIRLGGIYALEGVMNDPTSKQYHRAVLEALCAFVRDRTHDLEGEGPPATDIQAALTVIGRRRSGTGAVNLSGSHIPKAHLPPHANLIGADLTSANLSDANLTGAIVEQDQLDKACGDNKTKLPPGMTIKKCK